MRQVYRRLHDSHTASTTVTRTVYGITLFTQSSLKHSVTYTSFVRQYAVDCNAEDFDCGNLHKVDKVKKGIVENLEYDFPVLHV